MISSMVASINVLGSITVLPGQSGSSRLGSHSRLAAERSQPVGQHFRNQDLPDHDEMEVEVEGGVRQMRALRERM